MTQNEESNSFITSKFGKTVLTIIAVFLIFAGPTYIIYGLAVLLKVNMAASFATGFILFIVGLVIMRFLVKKKIIV
jgi:uncharacterized membrane protein